MGESVNDNREKWRAEYRLHRYLEHEPILKLHDRATAMTMNACGIDRSGKPYWRQGGRWFEMLTHTLEPVSPMHLENNPLLWDGS